MLSVWADSQDRSIILLFTLLCYQNKGLANHSCVTQTPEEGVKHQYNNNIGTAFHLAYQLSYSKLLPFSIYTLMYQYLLFVCHS